MRKAIATVTAAVIGLVGLTACSTKSTPKTSAPAPANTSSSPSTSSVQGVTATTIRVGITYVDYSAIRSIVDLDQGDFRTAYRALLDDINAHGGIAGRKIVPYFAAVNPIGTASAAAACTQLTEDDKVFVVLGFFNATDPACYLDTHGVNIIGGPATGATLSPQQQAAEKATWFNTDLTDQHLLPKELTDFAKQGLFRGHKVAVVALASDQSVMQQVALPQLHSLGVDVVQTAINDVSPTDLTAFYQQMALISQKFQSAGADIVVAVGQGASQGWPQSLQANHSTYLPRLVATNYTALQSYVSSKTGYDPATLAGAVSASPGLEAYQTWSRPAVQHCVSIVSAAHPSEPFITPTPANVSKQPQPWVSLEQACDLVTLLRDILQKAGRNLDNQTFLTAGESLHNVMLPTSVGPLNFGPGFHDGNGPLVLETWDSATRTFTNKVAG